MSLINIFGWIMLAVPIVLIITSMVYYSVKEKDYYGVTVIGGTFWLIVAVVLILAK